MSIHQVCVFGGGVMGRQISLCAAIHGYDATVYDISEKCCADVASWSEEHLAGRIAKDRMTADEVAAVKSRFHIASDAKEALRGADCVVECVSEREEIKKSAFETIRQYADPKAIIATNSSYMVSSTFKDFVNDPSKLANMHFYNPALVMKFVEIVKGPHTSEETAQELFAFCESCGKVPILMKKELPGFAANYILAGVYERAKYLVENGYCTFDEVDKACEYGLNWPLGPFRLNDLTGIDLSYDILKAKYEKTGVKPDCFELYENLYKQGRLGKKTGHGFYDYV